MTTNHSPFAETQELPPFASPQGLRRLLLKVFTSDRDGWSHPDVPALLRYCERKFGLLARRYGQDPADAVAAAFDVLRLPSTLDADDPWGVVTRAVQRTMQAADRADRLLCSVDHARRLMSSGDHDVERFSDLADDGSVPVVVERVTQRPPGEPAADAPRPSSEVASVRESITDHDVRIGLITVRTLLSWSGWPPDDARVALEYVCQRLRESGSPATAFDSLRRDLTPLHLLDVDRHAWNRLCRVLLGAVGHDGLIRRAMCGARPVHLLADSHLMATLALTAPAPTSPEVRHG